MSFPVYLALLYTKASGWLFLLLASLLLGSRNLIASSRPITEPITLDKVIAYITTNPRVRSVEALLGALPASYLSHYTLLHHSQSLQGASPEFPRVILYGPDGKFILAFNGSPAHEGFHTVEMIQWRPPSRSFEMRRIRFGTRRHRYRRPRISRPNPSSCLGCHGSDPRPNWEPYSEWPMAYAGIDDQLDRDGEDLNRKLGAFIEGAPRHPRYRRLVGLREGYLRPTVPGRRPPDRERTPVEHNIRLSEFLSTLNSQRIARLMEATDDYEKYRYAAMAILLGCSDAPEAYVPDELPPAITNLEHGPRETRAELLLRFFGTRTSNLLDWSMSFGDHSYRLDSPNSWPTELLYYVLRNQRDVAENFHEYIGYHNLAGAAERESLNKTCAELLRLSVEAFAL